MYNFSSPKQNVTNQMVNAKPVLLSIIELGGYPDFSGLYRNNGYEVVTTDSVRKAVKLIRKHHPDVIVAEFNFQSDFRDRTSSHSNFRSMKTGWIRRLKMLRREARLKPYKFGLRQN